MSAVRGDEHIVKAYCTEEGTVWYADGNLSPTSSGEDVAAFLASALSRDVVHLRVIGLKANASLIVEAYKLFRKRKQARLEVASPRICENTAERLNPEMALLRMRQCLLPPSLGGWHEVTVVDYPAYAITASYLADEPDSQSCLLMRLHPVWQDLSFIGSASPFWCAMVVGAVLDPRWHIDYSRPERLSRVRRYLGLSPLTQRRVSAGIAVTRRETCCMAVTSSWKGTATSPPEDVEHPRHFLWRRWRAAGGGPKGDLSASRAFVAFLIRTWQQRIADLSETGQSLEMFLPDTFFRDYEADAYREHKAAFRR